MNPAGRRRTIAGRRVRLATSSQPRARTITRPRPVRRSFVDTVECRLVAPRIVKRDDVCRLLGQPSADITLSG
jgi:hypothetical protein